MLHSETPGSKRVCRSPGLIAACRVLRRLMMPRHPSCARIRLTETDPPSRVEALVAVSSVAVQFSKIGKLRSERASRRTLNPWIMVGVTGVGPVTSSLSGTRSNQLSYTPRFLERTPVNHGLSAGRFARGSGAVRSFGLSDGRTGFGLCPGHRDGHILLGCGSRTAGKGRSRPLCRRTLRAVAGGKGCVRPGRLRRRSAFSLERR